MSFKISLFSVFYFTCVTPKTQPIDRDGEKIDTPSPDCVEKVHDAVERGVHNMFVAVDNGANKVLNSMEKARNAIERGVDKVSSTIGRGVDKVSSTFERGSQKVQSALNKTFESFSKGFSFLRPNEDNNYPNFGDEGSRDKWVPNVKGINIRGALSKSADKVEDSNKLLEEFYSKYKNEPIEISAANEFIDDNDSF